MIRLTSVSNPVVATGPESAFVLMPQRSLSGSQGEEPAGDSLAAEHLLVKGKSSTPMSPRLVVQPRMGLESVLGVDDRQRILETHLAPWRMICSLRMKVEGGGTAIGTGWLVGPRTLVTAGHCVHSTEFFGGWATNIEVTPGRNGGNTAPFGTFVSTRFSTVDRWANDADPNFDIGCIQLDEAIGDRIGWFGLASLSASELEQHLVNISGYPADRGWGAEQYHHANRVLRVTERRIFYDVDTYGGESGAPVWIYREGESLPLAVGIHAYGEGGTPSSFGITANSAPRIIPEVFDKIEAWIKESERG